MGGPDYERWLREKRRSEVEVSEDDADIRAEEAREGRFREHYYDRARNRWDTRVPMRHWTSGTWAQIFLTGVYWAVSAYLLHGTELAPKDRSLQSILWLFAFVPSLIAGIATWHLMGRAMRERTRTLIRLSPLLLAGLIAYGAMRRPPKSERSRPSALAQPTGESANTPAGTSAQRPTSVLDLSNIDLDAGLHEIETWWNRRSACVNRVRSAAFVPSSGGPSLQDSLRCVRETERDRDAIEAFAQRHEAKLLEKGRATGKPTLGLILAFGHLTQPAEALRILAAWGRSEERAMRPELVEALTLASMRWPSELSTTIRALPPERPRPVTLLFATVEARIHDDRHRACRAIAELAVDEADYALSSAAHARLLELAPFCASLTPEILDEIRAGTKERETRDQEAEFRAHAWSRVLEGGRLRDFAAIRALMTELKDRPDLQLVRSGLGRSAEALVERAFFRKVGLSPLVFGHPQTRSLLSESAVHKAACTPEDLGISPSARAELPWIPDCVDQAHVPDWIRAPLESWRARLDGWDAAAYRHLPAP